MIFGVVMDWRHSEKILKLFAATIPLLCGPLSTVVVGLISGSLLVPTM